MAEIHDVTDHTFEVDVVQAAQPTLVDFWGDHCPACRQISPILQEVAGDFAGRVNVVKMHAVENPQASAQYGVRAMPTVLAFAGGRVVGQLVGARPKKAFVELAEQALAENA